MEEDLDKVEEGHENWVVTLKRFYGPFKKRLGEAKKKMPVIKRKGVPTGIKCDVCGSEMVIKWGRNGEFLACSTYPKCTNTKEFSRDEQGVVAVRESAAPETVNEVCDKCGKPMVRRRSRFGEFLGCSGYPDCDGIKRLAHQQPVDTGVGCPECGDGQVMERRSRKGRIFYGCGRYPKCKFVSWNKVVPEKCPECGANYLVEKVTKRDGARWMCVKEGCEYKVPAPASAEPVDPPETPASPAAGRVRRG
jgi:DNA topoisomerase-1